MFAGSKSRLFQNALSSAPLLVSESDGRLRFETDDRGAELRLPAQAKNLKVNQSYTTVSGKIFHHPELYAHYPELALYPVVLKRVYAIKNTQELACIRNGTMYVYYPKADEDAQTIMRSSMLHEHQHLIQDTEGFSPGGSSKNLRFKASIILEQELREQAHDAHLAGNTKLSTKFNLMALMAERLQLELSWPRSVTSELSLAPEVRSLRPLVTDMVEDKAFALYEELPGEVEARAVSARSHMSMSERHSQPPAHLTRAPEEHIRSATPAKLTVPEARQRRLGLLKRLIP